MKGRGRPFEVIPKNTGKGLKAPDYERGKVWTGKPILEVSLKDAQSAEQRLAESKELQAAMHSWIGLENKILALKEQDIPIVWRPKIYGTNKPLDLNSFERIAYFSIKTLPNICGATEVTLDSLSCYLQDCLKRYPTKLGDEFKGLIREQLHDVEEVRRRNQEIIIQMTTGRKS